MATETRLEYLERLLSARRGNPAMGRSIEMIEQQIAAIKEAQAKTAAAAETGDKPDGR